MKFHITYYFHLYAHTFSLLSCSEILSQRYRALSFRDTTSHIFDMKPMPCNAALYLNSRIF
jgi:hypothetical protein